MTAVSPSTTFTPGLEFGGKAYSDRARLFGNNVLRARAIIEEKLPVSYLW